ncbi:DUF7660 family protein [Bacillus nitratireducens]|uniref:DUF7660 family protein n=1 Tax=Bacillus nitratireducens TaxID=2026193 RepID=UPI000BEB36B1|nr:hypothetical protein [Bacillus nitratireducens]PEE16642.1 hypothetical protein CON53_16935 [Bacillus cereus]MED0904270.1 hypothetical protein [Bacillus nitratireducens]PFH92299.1 hypothetical protein COI81_06470 [Bacillus cereus]PFM62294.1 hypothetical protein COJ52_01905 [Bacillus cereus]PGS30405.1 hypothetical protein COC55_03935 [Bacillus cereus]
MDLFEYFDHVNSKEDLLKFLVYLQKDFKVNQGEWENIEVETYLEALHGWLGAYEGVYINQGEKLPENIPWKFIAQMLLAAAYYE